jgi:hypothetical protein
MSQNDHAKTTMPSYSLLMLRWVDAAGAGVYVCR